jgi:hypothetical protein
MVHVMMIKGFSLNVVFWVVIVFEVDTNIWKEQATSVFNAEMLLAGN